MDYNQIEVQLQNLINQVRVDPQSMIPDLKEMLKNFRAKYYKIPGTNVNIATDEGEDAVNEAIEELKKVKPMKPLIEAHGMYFAARDHAEDIGNSGSASHEGSDKSRMCDRIDRYGEWDVSIAENVVFDENRPKEIFLGMLVDDGNSTRGHRHNILNPDFKYFGIAISQHIQYKFVTIVTFAVEFKDKSAPAEKKPVQEQFQRKILINAQNILGGSKKQIVIANSSPEDNSKDNQKISQPLKNKASNEPSKQTQDQNFGQTKNTNVIKLEAGKNVSISFDGQGNAKVANLDVHDLAANWDSDPDAPEDAVACTIKRFVKIVNKKKIVRVVKIYTLKDGSQEQVEEIKEETS